MKMRLVALAALIAIICLAGVGSSQGPGYPIYQGTVRDGGQIVEGCWVHLACYPGEPDAYTNDEGHYVIYSGTRQAGDHCVEALKGIKKDAHVSYYNGSSATTLDFNLTTNGPVCPDCK
jgi:hypothetical protein